MLAVILLPLASAITIESGVLINTTGTNVTYNITGIIDIDNITVSNNYMIFNNDNISIDSNKTNSIININTWNDDNNQFTSNDNQILTYNITNVKAATITNNNNFKFSPALIYKNTYFSYSYPDNLTIYFRDQGDNSLVTENITVNLISEQGTYTYYTTNGYISKDVINAEYEIRYGSANYPTRTNILTHSEDQNITYYLINNSDAYNVTITLYDINGETISNAVVRASKYDLTTNTYLEQESETTDQNGQVRMSLTLNDEYYRFTIVYNGVTVKVTPPTYINSNEISITNIILGSFWGDRISELLNLDYAITYNEATNNARLEYSFIEEAPESVCLTLYRLTMTSKNNIDSSCINTQTGTILLSVPTTEGTNYEAQAYYTINGVTYTISSIIIDNEQTISPGSLGLLMQVLLTGSTIFIGFSSAPVFVILLPISIAIGKIIGLNSLSWAAITPLIIIGLIIGVMLGVRRR